MITPSGYNQPMYDVLLVDSGGALVTGIAGSDPNLRIAFGSGGSATVCAAADIETVATLDAYQAPSAGTKVRWREVSAANFPGQYQIHLPASAHASATPVRIRVYDTTATPRWVEARGVSPVLTPSDVQAVAGSEAEAFTLALALQHYDNVGFKSDVVVMQNNVIMASTIASGAFTGAKFASGAFDAVWSVGTRTLTSFGSLVADIWNHATRTLTSIADSSGVTTLLGRIVGTLASGTHQPQSGDSFSRIGTNGEGLTKLATQASVDGLPARVWDYDRSLLTDSATAGYLLEHPEAAVGYVAAPSAGTIADAVLDELLAGHVAPGSLGEVVGAMRAILSKLDVTLESDGPLYRFTINALEQAPGGGGGGGGIDPNAVLLDDGVTTVTYRQLFVALSALVWGDVVAVDDNRFELRSPLSGVVKSTATVSTGGSVQTQMGDLE